MSTERIEIVPPTKDNAQKFIQWIVWIVPALVVLFAIYALLNINDCVFSSGFTYFLLGVLFGLRLYIHATKFFNHNEPIWKILLYSVDAHILIYVLAFVITGLHSILFFIDIILMNLGLCMIVLKKVVAPEAGSMKDTLVKIADAYNECEYINQARAIIEILEIPYLFCASLVLFSLKVFGGFAIYFVGFAGFMMLTDQYHRWVWDWLDDKLSAFARQNDQSFGPYIKQVLDVCHKVPELMAKIYPDANGFFETIKRKIE